MGYVESSLFFCATTKTVKDCALDTIYMCNTVPPHHLESLADNKPPQTSKTEAAAMLAADNNWEALSPHAWATYVAHVKVYLDDFILIVQGGTDERRQMTRHLFCAINELFLPNTKYNTACEDPISLKKLRKCNAD